MTLEALLHDLVTRPRDGLSSLTTTDALRIPAVELLIADLLLATPASSDITDDLALAYEMARESVEEIAITLANTSTIIASSSVVVFPGADGQVDRKAGQLIVDLATLGALVLRQSKRSAA